MSKPTYHSSVLSISQTIDTEKDEDKNCKNYPYLNFSSFGDCDDFYVQQKIQNYDIVPFWATKDFDKVTKLYNGSHYHNPYKPWGSWGPWIRRIKLLHPMSLNKGLIFF